MIRQNQKIFNVMHVLLDAVAIIVSYALAWYIKFHGAFSDPTVGVLPASTYFSVLIAIVPGYLIIYYALKLYDPKRGRRAETEILDIFKANTLGALSIMVVIFAMKIINFSRGFIVIFYFVNIVATILIRAAIRHFLRFLREKGYNLKFILLVGYSRAAEEYIVRINSNPHWGYVIKGILDDRVPRGTEFRGVKVLGTIANLDIILPLSRLDEIAVTLPLFEYYRLEEIVGKCEKSGVHTKFIPDYSSIIPSKPYTEELMGLPIINIRHVPLTNLLNKSAKRIFDIVGSIVGIILSMPLLIIIAILIKLTSKGSVIYKQVRVGLGGKEFYMYKFRSMVVQSQEEEAMRWTTRDDDRVTKIGRFIRRSSIDELPQLFNVLSGKMSLVGPRPERPQFVEKFKEEIPRYMIKHQVRPGITGWAQVNGYRGDTSIRLRIDHDLFYIENWTMSFDIKIMIMTIFKGFMNENAI